MMEIFVKCKRYRRKSEFKVKDIVNFIYLIYIFKFYKTNIRKSISC